MWKYYITLLGSSFKIYFSFQNLHCFLSLTAAWSIFSYQCKTWAFGISSSSLAVCVWYLTTAPFHFSIFYILTLPFLRETNKIITVLLMGHLSIERLGSRSQNVLNVIWMLQFLTYRFLSDGCICNANSCI